MSAAQLENIRPGVQVRYGKNGNTIRYFAFVAGKRHTAPCVLPYESAVNTRTRKPTRLLEQDYAAWVMKLREQNPVEDGRVGLKDPSIAEIRSAYEAIATERSHNPMFMKPGLTSITNHLKNLRYCMEAAGLTEDRPFSQLADRKVLQRVMEKLALRMKPISAWSMIVSVRMITAKWSLDRYESMGYRVVPTPLPDKPKTAEAPQYKMMSREVREKVDAWYISTRTISPSVRLVASLVYQLAIRPIDVRLLTADNFYQADDGYIHLRYTPHKTEHSSGREVDWPVVPALWDEIREIAGERMDAGLTLVKSKRNVFDILNASLREACGFEGAKALYELRKLCIDTIRRIMGSQAAVALSGDRPDTVDHYYADPYKMTGIKPIEIGPLSGPVASDPKTVV